MRSAGIRGAVHLFIGVVVDGEELDGVAAFPAFEDVCRGEAGLPVEFQIGEVASGGQFGPLGAAAANFDAVEVVLDGEQADRSFDHPGSVEGEFGPVEAFVEGFGRVGVAGMSEDGVVSFREGDLESQRTPFASGVEHFGLRGVVSRDGDGFGSQVAGYSVDCQFHVVEVLFLTVISRAHRVPRRWMTASSVRTSIGV